MLIHTHTHNIGLLLLGVLSLTNYILRLKSVSGMPTPFNAEYSLDVIKSILQVDADFIYKYSTTLK